MPIALPDPSAMRRGHRARALRGRPASRGPQVRAAAARLAPFRRCRHLAVGLRGLADQMDAGRIETAPHWSARQARERREASCDMVTGSSGGRASAEERV